MRWRIEHAQILRPSDYHWFRDLPIIASMQPSHAIGDRGNASVAEWYAAALEATPASERPNGADVRWRIEHAQIIDPAAMDADGRCVFGATVDLEDADSGQAVTYQIVGEDEADIKQGKISYASPLARALIGKFAGDVVQVQTPGGQREYEMIDVRYV